LNPGCTEGGWVKEEKVGVAQPGRVGGSESLLASKQHARTMDGVEKDEGIGATHVQSIATQDVRERKQHTISVITHTLMDSMHGHETCEVSESL